MHLTQPAVTARIRNLENSLSTQLFERTSSGMKLTKRGELLLNHAERFVHLAELVERDVIDPGGIDRRLRIGVSETIAQCWLPEFVAALRREFPKLEVEINVDISVNLRSALLHREVDLVILLGPVSEYTVDNLELPNFELAWYTSAHELVTDAACWQKPVVTYAKNTRPYRELKAELFERVGPSVTIFPSSSLSACFRLVEAGLGVAALPKVLGDRFVKDGKLQEFDPGWKPNPLTFTASYLGDPPNYLVETAAKIAADVAKKFSSDK